VYSHPSSVLLVQLLCTAFLVSSRWRDSPFVYGVSVSTLFVYLQFCRMTQTTFAVDSVSVLSRLCAAKVVRLSLPLLASDIVRSLLPARADFVLFCRFVPFVFLKRSGSPGLRPSALCDPYLRTSICVFQSPGPAFVLDGASLVFFRTRG